MSDASPPVPVGVELSDQTTIPPPIELTPLPTYAPSSYAIDNGEFDVQLGEVWMAGPHVVACGDLELDHADRLLDLLPRVLHFQTKGPFPDVTYCDPPWTRALATGFRSKAGMPHQVDFLWLLDQIVATVMRTGEAWIEMGVDGFELLCETITANGGEVVEAYIVERAWTRRGYLVWARWEDRDMPRPGEWNDHERLDTVRWVLANRTRSGQVVFDPCCGMGATAVACAETNRRFVGMELHPRRAAITLQKLSRYSGCDPALIRRLDE